MNDNTPADQTEAATPADLVRQIEAASGLPVEQAVYAVQQDDPHGFGGFPMVLSPEAKALANRLGIVPHEVSADELARMVVVCLQERVSLVEAYALGTSYAREAVNQLRHEYDQEQAAADAATHH